MNEPYFIVEPKSAGVPVILSVPHSGTEFPGELKSQFRPELAAQPDDTDWFVHDLYDFAPDLGITTIHARYSRWTVDLNRDAENKALYHDGRIITGVTPATDFFGNDIYINEKFIPDEVERNRRLKSYYQPYHLKIRDLLEDTVKKFGRALLWDAHSIRRFVPTINPEPFPDLILGDNDGNSADREIIEIALDGLRAGEFQLNHNAPFKGGQITRFFGRPEKKIHALQLEMSKTLYMNDDELTFNRERAGAVRKILRPVFENLIAHLTK